MGKITELDGLRGLLAVWVVVVHLLPSAGVSARNFGFFAPLFGEHLRVQIFCILSGFVIFLMLQRRREMYRTFLMGRLSRIYPAYVLAFILSALLSPMIQDALQSAPFGGERMEDRAMILQNSLDRAGAHVLAHLTLMHGVVPQSLLPSAPYAFLGQAWNISTEFQFYLVAPLLFSGLATGLLWRRVAFLGLCLLGWLALRRWPNPASLAAYAPYFALGMASFAFWVRNWTHARWLRPGPLLMVASLTIVLGDMAVGIWVAVLGWLVLVRDHGCSQVPVAWLASGPMLWLGRLSYALYLFHMLPMYLGMYVINGLWLDRAEYLSLLGGITFGLALPLAWLVTVGIERVQHGVSGSSRRHEKRLKPHPAE